MGFTDAHWTVKHKILFPRDKLKGFQFLPAECRGKFNIELTIRYLMHPKKGRFVESVIWNKVLESYKEGRIDLFPGMTTVSYTHLCINSNAMWSNI